MEKFAFITHPLEIADYYRKFPFLKPLPDSWVERLFKHVPAMKVSDITGIVSKTGKEAEGWFVGCPLTAKMMMQLDQDFVMKKIIESARLAEKLGAKIVGLGAFTSVVGDAGITVAKNVNIAVTTGNSYTVGAALEGIKIAAEKMEVDLEEADIAIIGATGSIGSACAKILAKSVKYLTLAARDINKLNRLSEHILHNYGLAARTTTDIKGALKRADIIITVTGAVEAIIEPWDLKPGAIVLDVARPRDVSRQVGKVRDDVLVVEGGVIKVPGENVNFNFNFGFPPGLSYACMAETMILALEGRYENFSLGRDYSVESIEEICRLAEKHGFQLAGLRSFERALTDEQILRVKENAEKKRKTWTGC